MTTDTFEIPVQARSSVETFDEFQGWFTAQNPEVMAELLDARKAGTAGEFKAWKPKSWSCPAGRQ